MNRVLETATIMFMAIVAVRCQLPIALPAAVPVNISDISAMQVGFSPLPSSAASIISPIVQSNGLPVECPIIDAPICGADGITYQNECKLQRSGAKKAYDGWCSGSSSPVVTAAAALVGTESKPDLTVFVMDAKNGFMPSGRPYSGCSCDFTFNPICGENGVTYSNYCRAACKNVKPVHYGQCGAISYDSDPRNVCQCDFSHFPVCGVNGITYENSCVSACFSASVSFSGYCNLPCSCRFFFRPVCGENGRNYVNQCLLDCAQVNKFSDGLCANDTKCRQCFGIIKKVCGRDGKTYDNECYMECAGARKQHDGHCVERWSNSLYDPFSNTYGGYSLGVNSELPNDLNRCFCPKTNLPVCGRNSVTYSNECELNCAGILKAKNGVCGEGAVKEDPCTSSSKSMSYQPVCGSNRVTYYNKNMIACDSGVSVLYDGECKPINYEWCKCSNELRPVCGVDGKTYLNEEVLRCVGVEKYCDHSCELGANGWKIGPEQRGDVHQSKRVGQDDKRFDERINEYWYNTIWGDQDGEWTCGRRKDALTSTVCKPQVNIKYMMVKRVKQRGCVVFMPPCRNLDSFSLPYKKSKFPGFQGYMPDPKYISYVLENSYTKEKVKIDDILEKVFKSKDSQVGALNFFVPLDEDFKSEFEVKQRVAEQHKKNIPNDHKETLRKDPILYYLYFTLLIDERIVTPETKINDSYCVKDALFFIVQDIWKLDLDMVLQGNDGMAIDFDNVINFK